MPSRLDGLYRSLLLTKFFCKGWGRPDNLHRLFEFKKIMSNREVCAKLVSPDYPVAITKDEKTGDCRILEGKFTTPFAEVMPGIVPKESEEAHFQVMLPNKWKDPKFRPMCIHLAGTGDHYYWKRRNLVAKPLMKEGNIGSIILENPFYGVRKPAHQKRSSLDNVSDIFVMGGCLILECMVLLHWCERNGFGPLGVTGLSMGGHMASLAATNWPKPLVLVPCLSWSTASSVFTEGVMTQSINWDVLETQYFSDGDYRERLAKMVTIVDDAFLAGQKFVKHFNNSILKLQDDIKDAAASSSTSTTDENTGDNITNVFGINRSNNSLNLSPALLEKLLSKDNKCSLTQQEINELNEKIREAQTRWSGKQNGTVLSDDRKVAYIEVPMEASAIEIMQLANGITVPERSAVHAITSVIYGSTTKLMKYILPTQTTAAPRSAPASESKEWWQRESLQFMRGVMDECTHLKNFSVPVDTSLIISVCAKDDAYVPREDCTSLEEVWPGAEVRYLDAGHVSAYVLHQKLFRSCIIEAFERARIKYPASLPNSDGTDNNERNFSNESAQ